MKTANEFLKEIQEVFGPVEYRATSNEGKVFKSKGWDNAQVEFDKREFRQFNNQIKRIRF